MSISCTIRVQLAFQLFQFRLAYIRAAHCHRFCLLLSQTESPARSQRGLVWLPQATQTRSFGHSVGMGWWWVWSYWSEAPENLRPWARKGESMRLTDLFLGRYFGHAPRQEFTGQSKKTLNIQWNILSFPPNWTFDLTCFKLLQNRV